jgi:hypothetical protein
MSDADLKAVKSEAKRTTTTVVFRDAKFEIDPGEDWVMDFLHWTDRDKITLALEVALGSSQYEQLRAMTPRPKLREYMGLLEQIGSTLSVGLGEA